MGVLLRCAQMKGRCSALALQREARELDWFGRGLDSQGFGRHLNPEPTDRAQHK